MVPSETDPSFPRLTLLAPQGAEYQAVRQGAHPDWPVVALPMGSQAIPQWWATYERELTGQSAILLGLAGGLHPDLTVGIGVICQQCTDKITGLTRPCDPELTQWLSHRLALPVVPCLTVPQIVTQPQAKQELGQTFHCAVVDMEGYHLLGYLPRLGVLRVVSDEMAQPLPDVQMAVNEMTGALQPLPLAWAMVQRPGAAIRLIQSSLTALGRLTALTRRLTGNSEKNYNKISSTGVSQIQT